MSLEFARHTLHDIAIIAMAIIYFVRLYWLTRFPAGKERQAPTGRGSAKTRLSVIYSWGNIAMPWEMESSRRHFLIWTQFVLFHLGVVAAIVLMFSVSFFFVDQPLPETLALVFQIIIGVAFLIGVLRIIRRFTNKYVRTISSPDDHFSLWLLTAWFLFGYLSAPNNYAVDGETYSLVFFVMGSFFLIYVPFSKISHYLYYPFTRMFLGKTFGRRGVYPIQRVNN